MHRSAHRTAERTHRRMHGHSHVRPFERATHRASTRAHTHTCMQASRVAEHMLTRHVCPFIRSQHPSTRHPERENDHSLRHAGQRTSRRYVCAFDRINKWSRDTGEGRRTRETPDAAPGGGEMLLQVYVKTEDGRERLTPIADVLNLDDSPYFNIDEMMGRLLEMQTAGEIRISPNPEALQRMAVRAGLHEYLRRDRADDGVRRFVSTRNGGRVNRTARAIGQMEDAIRADAIRSIQRFMNEDAPAAYRSQAALLGALDPTADPEIVARTAGRAVEQAVRTGIEEGRAAVRPETATG